MKARLIISVLDDEQQSGGHCSKLAHLHRGDGLVELFGVLDAGDTEPPHGHEGVVLSILQNELG
jgi:hypothetical protein